MKTFFRLLPLLSLVTTTQIIAQEAVTDTIKLQKLDEVVITGQIEPLSIKKSVHNVRIISSKDIQNLAANNLGDVLNQYLNITVRPSSNSGRSTVSMFGLDAQYFKILVDNIPLVNEAGQGNNIDLTQINLNDIEQIEIIEGAMGVTHGANAVSGLLNIITKKSSINKWNISATLQEETIGKEYGMFNEGRHIQALNISHNINENWYVSLGGNRNDFKGFLNEQQGKDYQFNDGKRGYRWLPKEQWQTNALIGFNKENLRLFYKFEYFDEKIDFYNSIIQSGYSPALGQFKYAFDNRYFTNRFFHHLNGSGLIANQINYNISLSHQIQKREVEDFEYNLTLAEEQKNTRDKDQSMEVIYSTGTFSNFIQNKRFDIQLGYEASLNEGFSLVEGENSTTKEIKETIKNFDVFAVSEVKVTDNFSVRPGARYSFQSMFNNQYAYSLGLRQLLNNDFELRGSIGKSYRTPSFEEMFSEIVFSGHYFVGNENLTPELNTSYEVSVKKNSYFDSGALLTNNLMVSYVTIKDRIDMALIGYDQVGNPMNQYINISNYEMWNISSTNKFNYNNWDFSIGASIIGISREINNGVSHTDDRFLHNFNLNAAISYKIPNWGTTISTYYKYTGKTQQFIELSDDYYLSDIDDYSWLDISVRKELFDKKLEITAGARNLFNITDISQTRQTAGGVHAPNSNLMLAYGTSYFLKLVYNLNF